MTYIRLVGWEEGEGRGHSTVVVIPEMFGQK